MDGTVEAALRIVAGHSPKDESGRNSGSDGPELSFSIPSFVSDVLLLNRRRPRTSSAAAKMCDGSAGFPN